MSGILPMAGMPLRVAVAPFAVPGQRLSTVTIVLGITQPMPPAAAKESNHGNDRTADERVHAGRRSERRAAAHGESRAARGRERRCGVRSAGAHRPARRTLPTPARGHECHERQERQRLRRRHGAGLFEHPVLRVARRPQRRAGTRLGAEGSADAAAAVRADRRTGVRGDRSRDGVPAACIRAGRSRSNACSCRSASATARIR